MSVGQRNDFVRLNGFTPNDISKETVILGTTTRYIHNGDDFVCFETDSGTVYARCSSIADYRVSGSESAPALTTSVTTTKEDAEIWLARFPKCDLPELPDRKGPYQCEGMPYFIYPDGRVDGLTVDGWWRLSSLDEYKRYIARITEKRQEMITRTLGRRPRY
jgi:hypothetical protein